MEWYGKSSFRATAISVCVVSLPRHDPLRDANGLMGAAAIYSFKNLLWAKGADVDAGVDVVYPLRTAGQASSIAPRCQRLALRPLD